MTKMDISCTSVYCNIYSVNFIPGCFYLKNQYCCTKLFYHIFFWQHIPKQQITDLSKITFFYKVKHKIDQNWIMFLLLLILWSCNVWVIKKSLLIYGMYILLSFSCHEMITFMFDVFKLNAAICSKKTTTWHFQLTRFLGKFDFAKTFLHHPRNVFFCSIFCTFVFFLSWNNWFHVRCL